SGNPGDERDLHLLRAQAAVLAVELLHEAARLVPVHRPAVAGKHDDVRAPLAGGGGGRGRARGSRSRSRGDGSAKMPSATSSSTGTTSATPSRRSPSPAHTSSRCPSRTWRKRARQDPAGASGLPSAPVSRSSASPGQSSLT